MGLRVLYIVSILPPYPGGAAVCYGNILRGLVESRDRNIGSVTVLTEQGCETRYGEPVKVRDKLYRYDSAGAAEKRFLKQALNYFIIMGYILFSGSDVVHIHARYVYARYIGRLVWLALLLSRAKTVIDIRDRFYRNFGFGHHFLVCSKDLMTFYGWIRNKEYLPVPMDFPELKKSIEAKHRVGYFGAIAGNKGIRELVDGYKEYRDGSDDPLELHIWGQNMMGTEFEAAMASVQGVNYKGSAAPDEVLDRMLECKAVVLPSRSEGMPRVCLEAMYCGRVVVCHEAVESIASSLPERFVLKDLSPREIKRVLSEVECYSGDATFDYDLEEHSRGRVTSRLFDFYRRVLSKADAENRHKEGS
ncbi:MAG: glycosyltransferase family 4 protein [Candidatus Methylomirabilis sp.]|nr:glycosyltransferase family 4 protein [Deltaproteobacteria bacterium]